MINQQTTPEPAIDLSALLRGWKTVLVATILAMVAGAALLASIAPYQEVSAKIIVEPREVALNGRAGSPSHDKEFLPTQSEIMQSPAVIEAAVQQVDKGISVDMLSSRLVNVTKNLKVDPLVGTSILLIRYTDVNAQKAADFLKALVVSYSEYLVRTEKQEHHELMLALTGRDTELQNTLRELQAEFDQLMQSHVAPGADPVAMARILAGLDENLATTQSRRITLERIAARISPQGNNLLTMAPGAVRDMGLNLSQDTTSANAVLGELAALNGEGWTGMPNPTTVEDRFRLAQSRLAELRQALGPNHPELQAARTNADSAEAELNRLIQTTPGILRQALESMRLQEQALQDRYDTNVRMNHLDEITRQKESQKLADIDRAQEAYETVHAQLQQWHIVDEAIAGGRAGIAVSVLEPPTPGERSFVANPVIVMGIAGLLGLMFGVVLLIALPQIRSLLPQQQRQPQSARFSPSV
ncbi:MAG: hypothetical protein DWI22_18855 [Planctomycetota bacterium]|nr:MAG: hypothetical protein DWI22_18855 [Planctomycetota bacterium]